MVVWFFVQTVAQIYHTIFLQQFPPMLSLLKPCLSIIIVASSRLEVEILNLNLFIQKNLYCPGLHPLQVLFNHHWNTRILRLSAHPKCEDNFLIVLIFNSAEVSLEAKNSFHVLVTMSCSESELAVAETQPSAPTEDLSKNYASPIVATPVSTITRPPLDIICVLDTSGSMSSDSKLKNLLFAGFFPQQILLTHL